MKKLRLVALALCTVLIMLALSGCSSFLLGEENEDFVSIKNITTALLTDGRTLVTITYTDSTISPTTFYLPQGKKGDEGNDGVGIQEITFDKVDKFTNVKITFTDALRDPVTFEVPDGVSVSGVSEGFDEKVNSKYIYFTYSNGNKSEKIYLQRGESGVGILKWEQIENADKSLTAKFILTDGREMEVFIPAPQKGNGILKIESDEDKTYYYLYIYYTDTPDKPQEIKFERPKDPNAWLLSVSRPSNEEGSDGDYCFDKVHQVVYVKEEGAWSEIIDFKGQSTEHSVKFDTNDKSDGGSEAIMPDGTLGEYKVNHNTYFTTKWGPIPTPVRPGYKFLGWYTTQHPNATNSPFTDLTPVLSDMLLYARWEKLSEDAPQN